MFKICICFLFGIMIGVSMADTMYEYYVSPNGSDLNPGTKAKPFRTIEKAQSHVRESNKNLTGDIVVNLRGGIYTLDKTVHFDERDSGNNDYYIIYRNFRNETPIISSTIPVKNWKPFRDGIFKARVDIDDFRQLYVNGQRAIRARTPDQGNYYRLLSWNKQDRTLYINRDQIRQWKQFKNVEMIVQMHWAEAIMRLESFKTENDRTAVIVQEPERHLVFLRDYPMKSDGQAFHFENALEFLDQPGEWYFDRVQKTVYYMPSKDQDMTNLSVSVPSIETLIKLEGTAHTPVQHIRFEGLSFQGTTWLRPSLKGHLNLMSQQYSIDPTRADIQYVGRTPAAVQLSYCENVQFIGNNFQNLGSTGLDLLEGTSSTLIENNKFRDIAGVGIKVARFSKPDVEMHIPYNPPIHELCQNDIIRNNIITRVGQDYPGSPAIACGYPRAILIEHNEIFDMPYCGITIGWGWTKEKNAMANNQVLKNNIYQVMKLMEIGAGVLTLSHQPGSLIAGNWIHDIEPSPWILLGIVRGIYLDIGTGGYTVEKNVISRPPWEAIAFNKTGKIIIRDSGKLSDPRVEAEAGLKEPIRRR